MPRNAASSLPPRCNVTWPALPVAARPCAAAATRTPSRTRESGRGSRVGDTTPGHPAWIEPNAAQRPSLHASANSAGRLIDGKDGSGLEQLNLMSQPPNLMSQPVAARPRACLLLLSHDGYGALVQVLLQVLLRVLVLAPALALALARLAREKSEE